MYADHPLTANKVDFFKPMTIKWYYGYTNKPDYLYAASGTMGTVIGLLLGLKAAGLRTRVMAIRVTDPQYSSIRKAHRLFRAANAVLHKADPTFPLLPFPESDFVFRHEHYGAQYALYTEEGVRAMRYVEDTEGIELEGTYTGKTFAALLADARASVLRDKTVVFWNTQNSRDFTAKIEGVEYCVLPRAFHRYFEQEVQPLDR
jgi:D-cysteine desulfhydrase